MNFVSWPQESESPLTFQVAPSNADKKTINTLVIDKPNTYVFWSSPTLLTPVTSGWFLHAASVPGCVDDFDVSTAPAVRWEHVQVSSGGLVPLQLADGRTYAFFLTAASASEAELKKVHFGWDVFARRMVASPPIDYILFPAQLFDFDDHGKEAAQQDTFDTKTYFYQVEAFNSDEHLLEGNYVQHLIDNWAANGLIQGGALIDTSAPKIEDWKFLLPYETKGSAALAPYGNVAALSRHHWHHIFPDADVDASKKPWTSTSLKQAIQDGKAVAVSVGHIVMLAGDYFGSFDDMKDSTQRTPIHLVQGFNESDRFAMMFFDVLTMPRKPKAKVDFMENVAKSQESANTAQSSTAPKVSQLVSAIRDASGPTRFSEIHALAQLWNLRTNLKGKDPKFPLAEMEERLPWFNSPRAKLSSTFTPEEMAVLDSPGFDDTFFSTIITNGHYGQLALNNDAHFSPANWQEFEKYHRRAFASIDQHAKQTAASKHASHANPIPAEAIALTAFGLHFLTDAFSAGHMRVPRTSLGPNGSLAAKLMHDFDGWYGLIAKDGRHKTDWRAFGDGYLDSDAITQHAPQAMLQRQAQRSGSNLTAKGAAAENLGRVLAAVASAVKQLHYVAQHAGAKKGVFHPILKNSKGTDAVRLRWDGDSSGEASDKKTLAEAINEDVDSRLAYLRQLTPQPKKVGKSTENEYNHPPLLTDKGAFNSASGAYEKFTRKLNYIHYLRLRWHGWTDYPEDITLQATFDLSQLYYVATYTKGAGSWAGGGEQKLLDILKAIPDGK